jgi:hypothetical protein
METNTPTNFNEILIQNNLYSISDMISDMMSYLVPENHLEDFIEYMPSNIDLHATNAAATNAAATNAAATSNDIADLLAVISIPFFIPNMMREFEYDPIDDVLAQSLDEYQPVRRTAVNVRLAKIKMGAVSEQFQSTKECCICYSSLVKSSTVSILKCDHVYHSKCILKWCSESAECPLCRSEILCKYNYDSELSVSEYSSHSE